MKKELTDLVVFGGKPAFNETFHVGQPNIANRKDFLKRINEMLDRRWLTNNGLFVREFEQKVAEFLGVKHCISMCNGTVALEIAIRALELKGEVIVPSFTFIATAHALQWQEITPVFCDIDPVTHNIDPEKIKHLITPSTTGVISVHLWGRACKVEALDSIAKEYDLRLLFDASHAFGCSYNGKMIGGFGEAEVFSFHATKFFNTMEGGAVVTNDDELAKKIRLMKNFGFDGMDNVIYLGINGKMNEASAAMGLTLLDSLDEIIETNKSNYKAYCTNLADIQGIKLALYDENERGNYQYIVLEIDEDENGISRDQLMKVLHAENVRARRYFYPGCHRMEPYHSYYPHAGLLIPETEKLSEKVVCLPTGTSIQSEDIQKICQIIRLVIENSVEIGARLSSVSWK